MGVGYERETLARLRGYVPGKQPGEREVVKLNTNENPYPPCEAVVSALRDVDSEMLRRYPPPLSDRFRETAARVHGLQPENVVAVNGGDELLRMAVTTFAEPGFPIGMVDPSYSLYPVLAAIHGSPMIRVPAPEDWSVPSDLARRMNAEGVRLLFLVNPHAPSGRLLPAPLVEDLASVLRGVLLVDEAYVDFVDPALGHDLVPLVGRFDNLLLLRSLSKGYSLAGLRFGYGLGARELIAPLLYKTRDSYNLDAVAQVLATSALEHRSEAGESWRKVRQARARLRGALIELGFRVPESQSNFLLASVTDRGISASAIHRALDERGILVRYFPEQRLRDALRITVGTEEQNRKLLEALGEIVRDQ
jgi:histidinol-phosphate aminotransferase